MPRILVMSANNPPPFAEFVTLLTEHQPDLWAYIITLMPGHPDVADVLQETNLVLWSKQEKFETGTNFRAWAFAIARFEVLNHLKKQKRNRILLLDEELLDTISHEAPEAIAPAEQRLKALEFCLEKLRPQDRELIDHRYWSRQGLDEFAEQVGRSVSALSVTLHRLRAALRKCVKDQIATEGGPS